MTITERVNAFVNLGRVLQNDISKYENISNSPIAELLTKICQQNPWFTPENTQAAIEAIANMLDRNNISRWISQYPELQTEYTKKDVGVVMAGNIPAVGFHDFLCVLLAGHTLQAKLSTKDELIMKHIAQRLVEEEPRFEEQINLTTNKLSNIEAVIATGSNNSSRYFEYYFAKYPHIIRHNRNSIAILTGNETDDELSKLANDVFRYFGMGCRNVSKLLIPHDYDVRRLYPFFERYKTVAHHNSYANNYQYNRAIYLINTIEHYDNNFLILREDSSLHSPIGVLHYEAYTTESQWQEYVNNNASQLQCVVGSTTLPYAHTVPFGETQNPKLWDYADGVDTMQWLLKI